MPSVLVTGGAGFIGSHLCHRLLQKGYHVRVLDNLSSGKKEWLSNQVDFMEGDIADLAICQKAMKDIEGVFHCAAMSRAGPSFDNVDLCTQSNVMGTQNILLAARDAGVKKVIYSGSSTYYGNQPPPHREHETSAEFLNFYALTKQVGEKYCLMFDELFDLPCIVLRYFNVYGPRQPEEGAYALVLGLFLRAASLNQSLIIHGDGLQKRDFIHVEDVVSANIAAFESPTRHQIFNVGSGTNISIKELANLISSNQVHVPRRAGDSDETLADISLIRTYLKWEPKISLVEGLTYHNASLS